MARTHDILDRCAGLARTTFPEAGGACTAREVAVYLAHTGNGESLRALAGATGTHASTVLRAVRRVESRRDDPLVERLFGALAMAAEPANCPGTDDAPETPAEIPAESPANIPAQTAPRAPADIAAEGTARLPREELEREARRYLRRLCEPGAFLLVTPDATKGGIFCRANEHRKPIAMLAITVAVEFLREGWIRLARRGTASIRYTVTEDGRSYLKRLLAEDAMKRNAHPGFGEAQTPFQSQHQISGERLFMNPVSGAPETLKVNLAEEPLGWLARRKGADGQPFVSAMEIEAGARLRQDFEAAQIAPSVAQDWRRFLTPGGRNSGTPLGRAPGEGPQAARERVGQALSALGPGLSDVALRVCCFLEGLEACEHRMGWSARSGKVVLKIALQRLSEHYGLAIQRR
ncbi:MAG TPA: DUF6456 domain-containing protein [Thermohalobaculum sp.]|nr:DUF6456 domain-containing protein [Thermohalobaculum sp.]